MSRIEEPTPRPKDPDVFTLTLEPEIIFGGGITYQNMNNYIAMQELNVLRRIVQREEILISLGKLLVKVKSNPERVTTGEL